MAVLLTTAESADQSCGRAFQGSRASGRTLGVVSKRCAIGSFSHQMAHMLYGKETVVNDKPLWKKALGAVKS
jgi:hypothetical protein